MKTKLKFMFMASVFLGIVIFAAIAADNSDSLNEFDDADTFDESMFEDDTGFSSFSDGTDSFSEDSGSTGGFGSFFSTTDSSLTFNGQALMEARAYIDQDDTDSQDSPTLVNPDLTLTATYNSSSTELEAKLNFSKDSIQTYNEDVIEEFTARAYLGNWIIEGGKMKIVWGKGLKLHAIDNFNATDYTNFLIPEYIDRRLAEPMLRAAYNSPSGWRMEAIYTPTMTGERYADKGVWVPGEISSLEKIVKAKALAAIGSVTLGFAQKLAAASSLSSDSLYPDTKKLKYGQAGIRFTGTFGGFDWGLSYYYGRNKKISAYVPKISAYIQDYVTNGGSSNLDSGLEYDRMQTFGIEGAKTFGAVNTRFEIAYNLTDDISGDDPEVRNNSITWVPGFDVPLPIHNMTLNVQELGTVILKSSKIKDNKGKITPGMNYDVDADSGDCYTNNKIAVAISDSFLHEKLLVDCTTIYGIERKDLAIMPKITGIIKTDIELYVQGLYIWCQDKDSEFYAWKNNSFAQIGIKYTF